MSEKNINSLPPEMLMAFLRRVEQKSLKNAALTCKIWKNIIDTSISLPLSLNFQNAASHDEHRLDFLRETNRKFHEIKIYGLVINSKIIDIFRKHGSNFSKLTIIKSSVKNWNLFVEMLKCMPKLKHVILFRVTTATTATPGFPSEDLLPAFVELKILEVVDTACNITRCFKRCKLSEFKLLGSTFETTASVHLAALELLLSQTELKLLALRSINDVSAIFRTDITNGGGIKFQLSQLSLLDIKLRESPDNYSNLLKLLKSQAKTIRFIELGSDFPDSIYKFILARIIKLKSLRLMINQLPRETDFYERLEENTSISQLIFTDYSPRNLLNNDRPPSLEEFIRRVPNVTDLTLLEFCDRETMQFIASNLRKLKRLEVAFFCESIFTGLQFPKLTTLCIQMVVGDFNWDSFTQLNPNITDVIIRIAFSDCSETNINQFALSLTRNLRLKTLRIGSSFPTSESFYKMLRESSDLKRVDLHRACASERHFVSGIPELYFHEDERVASCSKSKFWNPDDYDGHLPRLDINDDNAENMENDEHDDFQVDEQDDFEVDEHDEADEYEID